LIQDIAGTDVAVIDSAAAVARQLQRRLEVVHLLADATKVGTECFWTSGSLDKAQPLVSQLWQANVSVSALPDIEGRPPSELNPPSELLADYAK